MKAHIARECASIRTEEKKVLEHIEILYNDSCRSIQNQIKTKLELLNDFENELHDEALKIESTLDTLSSTLKSASKSHIIKNADTIIKSIDSVLIF
jgi:vacuolar-type H+-ATPase subunit I/STV1